jgi:hypothetical protein
MSNAEVGLFIRLLCLQAEHGSIPDSVERIVRAYGEEARELWTAVQPKFIHGPTEGTLVNERLCEVLAQRDAFRKRQSEKGKASAASRLSGLTEPEPRSNPGSTTVEPLGDGDRVEVVDRVEVEDLEVVEDTSKRARTFEPEVWPTFNDWWGVYDKKVDREKCERKWHKLSQAEKEKAYRHTEAYVPATPDVQFRRNPATYLNNKNWEDEQLTIPRQPTGQVRPEQLSVAEKARLAIQANAEFHASQRDAGPSYWDQ